MTPEDLTLRQWTWRGGGRMMMETGGGDLGGICIRLGALLLPFSQSSERLSGVETKLLRGGDSRALWTCCAFASGLGSVPV